MRARPLTLTQRKLVADHATRLFAARDLERCLKCGEEMPENPLDPFGELCDTCADCGGLDSAMREVGRGQLTV